MIVVIFVKFDTIMNFVFFVIVVKFTNSREFLTNRLNSETALYILLELF